MSIDIIVGNPPYQEETGAGTVITGKKPIYHYFVEQAIHNNAKYICMIIPSRWTNSGVGLDKFRALMESNGKHIRNIVDFMEWNVKVFENTQIAGGVMYFLYDRQYSGKCMYENVSKYSSNRELRDLVWNPTFIRNNKLLSIIFKINKHRCDTLDTCCRYNTFGLESYERGDIDGDLVLLTSEGKFKIQREKVKYNLDLIDEHKIVISGTTPSGGIVNKNGQYKVLGMVDILEPGEVCTGTYITISNKYGLKEIQKLKKYIQTKFVRALIQSTVSSMHITPYSFKNVPVPDLNMELTDEILYEMYELENKEIEYIEQTIRKWK